MAKFKSLTLITKNKTMQNILKHLDKVALSKSSVLLIGETGVGKEIFAEYVHRTSLRSQNPFVKISLSALPADLLESELFGHEKGAYTSAAAEKKGLFEIANTGSIFLDDIDDVPLSIQTKLLRVLESNELMRIGGTSTIPIDVRLICATKVDLKDLVNRKIFRADLFYRINVVPVFIPPLRERIEDIPPLIDHFLCVFSPNNKLSISNQALKLLLNYSWPGNIRELRNLIQRLSLFSVDEIKAADLPTEICVGNTINTLAKSCKRCLLDNEMTFEEIIECVELNLIEDALKKSNGNKTKAAKILKLNLSTFRDKLKKIQKRKELSMSPL